jgi:hypothetical protein
MTPAIPRNTALRQSRFVQSGCMGYLHWVRSWLYFDVKFVLSFAAFSDFSLCFGHFEGTELEKVSRNDGKNFQ